MKNFTFRQYKRSPKDDPKDTSPTKDNNKDPNNAAYLKRREQVRRAQRTHRERKETYIKTLETQVLELRTNEARLVKENRSILRELGRVKALLDLHAIPYEAPKELPHIPSVPPLSSSPLSAESDEEGGGGGGGGGSSRNRAHLAVLTNPHRRQQIHVVNPQIGANTPFYLTESEGSNHTPTTQSEGERRVKRKGSIFSRARGWSSEGGSSGGGHQATSTAEIDDFLSKTSNLNLRDMDQTNIGMEFVLTLEAPCLHHTQGEDPDNPESNTGHALTATAPLLFQSPTQPVDTTNTHTPSQWDMNPLGLETLLNLSQNFRLSDEITPVQAWHHIRSHPQFEALEIPGLRRLTEEMLKHVKCYGFGAVVDTGIFATLYRNLFPYGGRDIVYD